MWISLIARALDLLMPRRCTCCGQRLASTERVVCTACVCRLPRTYYWEQPYDNRMARLFWALFPVERAASLFFYHPHGAESRLITSLKYRSKPWVGEALGRLIAREMQGAGMFEGIDLLVPIPLSRKRRRQRGYNQSEHIARGISEVTGIPLDTRSLQRTSFKRSQTQLTPQERKENVKGLFSLARPERLEGKHLMLIDDIITTGSTMSAAAQTVIEAGGVKVSVVSAGFTYGGPPLKGKLRSSLESSGSSQEL